MLSFVSTSFGNLSSKEHRLNLFKVGDHDTSVVLKRKNEWNVITVCDPKGSIISLVSESVLKRWAA